MRTGLLSATIAAALVVGVVTSAGPAGATGLRPTAGSVSLARFEGRWIDLRSGWEGARACLIYPGRATECFRTRQALTTRVARLRSPDVSCATSLDLYDGTFQSGVSVSVFTRGLWINLSLVGFNNRTSSYVVGACAIELASGTNGGGSRYPRCLYAGCAENTMASGWNNVVSSVYLH